MKIIAELKGLSAVTGTVVGNLLVLDEKNSTPPNNINGKIAVIRIASPSIVVWLRHAQGLLVETGGPTCHAAIFAREMGIPCVVGVKGIFNPNYNGLDCLLDGTNGKVVIYDKE